MEKEETRSSAVCSFHGYRKFLFHFAWKVHAQVHLHCLRADSTTPQCFQREFKLNFDTKASKGLFKMFMKSKKPEQLQFTMTKDQRSFINPTCKLLK